MAVNIEIRQNSENKIQLDIPKIAALKDLKYGAMNDNYCLIYGETGKYTIMYNSSCIGRGMEVWTENDSVFIRIPLPNTESDIRLAYSLAQEICRMFGTDSFICDDEIVPFAHMEQHIQSNINASAGAIKAICGQIKNGEREAVIFFAVWNPITIGLAEAEEIDGTMEGFEKLLDRLQQIDVFYANPKYYKLNDDRVFGMFFVNENVMTVVPHKPVSLFGKIDNLKGYYVRVPDGNDIPYEEFIATAMKMGEYDSGHSIVCLTEKDLTYFAENCSVAINNDQKIKGVYWGRMIDKGRGHMRKVPNMNLATEEIAGLNHIAVFYRWAAEHNLLSEKLMEKVPELMQTVKNKDMDLREIIRTSQHIDCTVRAGHFKKECQVFLKSFYRFNTNGYPACVDDYCEKVLGSEKYNCEEYKNEAYLFVPYDEKYYKGLSKYIDKAWKQFNR